VKVDLFEQYKREDREGQRDIIMNAAFAEGRQIFKKQIRESVDKIMKIVKKNKKHNLESDVDSFVKKIWENSGYVKEYQMMGNKNKKNNLESDVDAFVRACKG